MNNILHYFVCCPSCISCVLGFSGFFFNKSCNLLSLESGMGMTNEVHRRSSDQKEIAEAIYVNVLE